MTHAPFAMFASTAIHNNNNNAIPSSSSFKAKRKRMSWGMDDEEINKHMRVRSPTMQHQYPLPELMTDHSNSASDDDQAMDHDGDIDLDMDNDLNVHMAMGMSNASHAHLHESDDGSGDRGMGGYMFASSGSGGFGFGPGAEEDDELELEMMDDMGSGAMKSAFPSLTPHPNPHHFSNPSYQSLSSHRNQLNGNFNSALPGLASGRATSPLAAQAYSTSLPAPAPRSGKGLLQPSSSGPVPFGASDVEKARNSHGPGCTSIPKLVLSEYPDASTGRRSLWSVCGDCGACEMAQ